MKTIPLTQGRFTIVDDEDYSWLNDLKWQVCKAPDTFYAVHASRIGGRTSMIYMHVMILGRKGVDHRDGNGLNNSRTNLRQCSPSQNKANARLYRNNSSGFKGVSWCAQSGKWSAHIRPFNHKLKHLGYFDSRIEAAKAYDSAALEHFGEFARTNKMMGLLK